jgi:pimeloyl-ACP methyl ester carboxylesterase
MASILPGLTRRLPRVVYDRSYLLFGEEQVMTIVASGIRAGMGVLGAVVPPAAAEIAYRAWREPGRREAVQERDADVHARARTSELAIAGTRVVAYAWGDGPETVLLVHGWGSRASRLAPLVRALESPHRTVVAFDAPGHGDSDGRRPTILDVTGTIARLGDRHGRFAAVIGHSFGVLSTFVAVREGVATDRIVGVSGMHDADQLLDGITTAFALSPRVVRGVRRRIEQRAFPEQADPWHRFVAELDPAETRTPVLLVHDDLDAVVDVAQTTRIAEAHNGPSRILVTRGLGHTRILRDPDVLGAVRAFVDGAPAPERSAHTGSPASRTPRA